ncbi:hypothetical protein QYE76_054025 [Lolium multiflorum]|uniref:Uncharacterized protein n=1 Tax=Lolium multiflorum TaxID=4521 RepID=A0AAD8SWW6_LOLMU|nr:hypothetical protein QYE76_054025 [Lolium multiflorum]
MWRLSEGFGDFDFSPCVFRSNPISSPKGASEASRGHTTWPRGPRAAPPMGVGPSGLHLSCPSGSVILRSTPSGPTRRTRLQPSRPAIPARDLFEEVAGDDSGIQSLTLGALDNRFFVSGAGIEVVKNFRHGVHGEGLSVKISGGRGGSKTSSYSMLKKAPLMRTESNMLLMSPGDTGAPHSNGVHGPPCRHQDREGCH